MPQFVVDDEVAALVERLAKKKPFENLSFNDALRRILQGKIASQPDVDIDELLTESLASRKKAASPSAAEWAARVSELKTKKGLNSWRAICDLLKIDTAGDSARRKLKNWVASNKPSWPPVPDV